MEVIYQLKKISGKQWDIVTDEGVLFYSGKTRNEVVVKLFSNIDLEEGTLILLDKDNKIIKCRQFKPKKINLDKAEFFRLRYKRIKERSFVCKTA